MIVSEIVGITLPGGSINVETGGDAVQIQIRLVTQNDKLMIPVSYGYDSETHIGFTYASEDTSIATVGSGGMVSGIAEGSTMINVTYTDENGTTYTCAVPVTVTPP